MASRPSGWWRSTSPNTEVLPHFAFRGQTPDEMYSGTGNAVPAELAARAAAPRRARVEANRSTSWHLVYNYADEVAPIFPAGTIVHIISWHDNSAANRRSPDPNAWVGYSQRTIDDMGVAWIGWVDLTREQYEQELPHK